MAVGAHLASVCKHVLPVAGDSYQRSVHLAVPEETPARPSLQCYRRSHHPLLEHRHSRAGDAKPRKGCPSDKPCRREPRTENLAPVSPSPLASSEGPEAFRCFLACAIHLSKPPSENTHSRSPSLSWSCVVSRVTSTMAPSDSLPNSPGLRQPPYTRSLLPNLIGQGSGRVSPVDTSSLPACRP